MSGALDAAGFYAGLCFFLGAAVILLSNAWGGYLLWIEFHGRTQPDFAPDAPRDQSP